MWQVKNPEIKPATLDFSTSEQAKLQVSQLFSDGVELINALELVDWDSEDTQLLVCEACGHTHCKSGDWVSIRKSNSLILSEQVIAFYLDAAEFIEWKALVFDGAAYRLLVDSTYVIAGQTAS